MQLHRPEVLQRLDTLDARILVVSFASPRKTLEWVPFFKKAYVDKLYARAGFEVTAEIFERTIFIADPELRAYHAFGLGRHSVWEAYGPRIVWQYLKWIAQGKPLRMTFQDTLQRGGDFVIDRRGILTLAHVGGDQAERPPVQKLLQALGD